MASRRLPDDWAARYSYRPVLLETFVEKPRFTGTCYKVANWLNLEDTKGRGKLDTPSPRSVHQKHLDLSTRTRLPGKTLQPIDKPRCQLSLSCRSSKDVIERSHTCYRRRDLSGDLGR
ncbi:Druantia anti-phage system protein DruA [Acidiferrobacter sp.]|uniref:Druantia anti-phage system protein DruA n=1 Tax=Acidiferrobacter sp. TaxID=1872107 RepID=UPI00343ED803